MSFTHTRDQREYAARCRAVRRVPGVRFVAVKRQQSSCPDPLPCVALSAGWPRIGTTTCTAVLHYAPRGVPVQPQRRFHANVGVVLCQPTVSGMPGAVCCSARGTYPPPPSLRGKGALRARFRVRYGRAYQAFPLTSRDYALGMGGRCWIHMASAEYVRRFGTGTWSAAGDIPNGTRVAACDDCQS